MLHKRSGKSLYQVRVSRARNGGATEKSMIIASRF